ncbi:MAG: hypothetical protein AB2L24_01530 [Mangrovibacterium sp.]
MKVKRRIFYTGLLLLCCNPYLLQAGNNKTTSGPDVRTLQLAVFDIDVTPPVGTRLAYDTEISQWDLGLRAKGIVISGSGNPIVLCAIDWIGIANEGYDTFRKALAEGAGTVPERVALHTVHQHDAPVCDFSSEKILRQAGLDPICYEGTFAREVVDRLRTAVSESLKDSKVITHMGLGTAKVCQVASNRRILGSDGHVKGMRYTSCPDSALRAEPEGLIDPIVSLVSFWNGEHPLAVLSYYAVHPQSYYRTGTANPDFPGLARFFRQLAVPEALHVHFNGAGGDIGAGKYNDGSKENRLILAERLADGMRRAWESTKKEVITIDSVKWFTEPVSFPPSGSIKKTGEWIRTADPVFLSNNLFKSAWLSRIEAGKQIDITCLKIGKARILGLPGEPFVAYQLSARAERPDLFVAVAGYGDYAPGYIPTTEAYKQGGYETSEAAGVTAEANDILMNAIRRLLHER